MAKTIFNMAAVRRLEFSKFRVYASRDVYAHAILLPCVKISLKTDSRVLSYRAVKTA